MNYWQKEAHWWLPPHREWRGSSSQEKEWKKDGKVKQNNSCPVQDSKRNIEGSESHMWGIEMLRLPDFYGKILAVPDLAFPTFLPNYTLKNSQIETEKSISQWTFILQMEFFFMKKVTIKSLRRTAELYIERHYIKCPPIYTNNIRIIGEFPHRHGL